MCLSLIWWRYGNGELTMKIYVHFETSLAGADQDDVLVVPDDATEEEIDEEVREWVFNFISWGWSKTPPGK